VQSGSFFVAGIFWLQPIPARAVRWGRPSTTGKRPGFSAGDDPRGLKSPARIPFLPPSRAPLSLRPKVLGPFRVLYSIHREVGEKSFTRINFSNKAAALALAQSASVVCGRHSCGLRICDLFLGSPYSAPFYIVYSETLNCARFALKIIGDVLSVTVIFSFARLSRRY